MQPLSVLILIEKGISMISEINHLTLAVSDINRSFTFYRDTLGFKPLCRWHAGAYFMVGELWLCLSLDTGATKSIRGDYTHYAFSIKQEEYQYWNEKLSAAGCTFFKENNSEGDSLYFLDPDGHKLELHVGNWQSRLLAKQQNQGSWRDVEFFD